jgi:hypothetical protein
MIVEALVLGRPNAANADVCGLNFKRKISRCALLQRSGENVLYPQRSIRGAVCPLPLAVSKLDVASFVLLFEREQTKVQ